MNMFKNSGMFQKLLDFGFAAVRCVATAGLAMFLILAWILTESLFRRGVHLSDLYGVRFDPKMKGRS
jgi:hypothetical protein